MIQREAGYERGGAPASRKASASVVTLPARVGRPLSRTPWRSGVRPVSRLACDGPVSGAVAIAVAKRTPRAASASTTGVGVPP
jgi:hypothetical protein